MQQKLSVSITGRINLGDFGNCFLWLKKNGIDPQTRGEVLSIAVAIVGSQLPLQERVSEEVGLKILEEMFPIKSGSKLSIRKARELPLGVSFATPNSSTAQDSQFEDSLRKALDGNLFGEKDGERESGR